MDESKKVKATLKISTLAAGSSTESSQCKPSLTKETENEKASTCRGAKRVRFKSPIGSIENTREKRIALSKTSKSMGEKNTSPSTCDDSKKLDVTNTKNSHAKASTSTADQECRTLNNEWKILDETLTDEDEPKNTLHQDNIIKGKEQNLVLDIEEMSKEKEVEKKGMIEKIIVTVNQVVEDSKTQQKTSTTEKNRVTDKTRNTKKQSFSNDTHNRNSKADVLDVSEESCDGIEMNASYLSVCDDIEDSTLDSTSSTDSSTSSKGSEDGSTSATDYDDGRSENYKSNINFMLSDAKFFVMKSLNSENIKLSKSENIWATRNINQKRLHYAFQNSKNVILIFSVNGTGKFCGFARVGGESNRRTGPRGWVLPSHLNRDKGISREFKIDWLNKRSLSFSQTNHLLNPLNQNRKVAFCRDGQEVIPTVGEQLCSLFEDDYRVDLAPAIQKSIEASKNKFFSLPPSFSQGLQSQHTFPWRDRRSGFMGRYGHAGDNFQSRFSQGFQANYALPYQHHHQVSQEGYRGVAKGYYSSHMYYNSRSGGDFHSQNYVLPWNPPPLPQLSTSVTMPDNIILPRYYGGSVSPSHHSSPIFQEYFETTTHLDSQNLSGGYYEFNSMKVYKVDQDNNDTYADRRSYEDFIARRSRAEIGHASRSHHSDDGHRHISSRHHSHQSDRSRSSRHSSTSERSHSSRHSHRSDHRSRHHHSRRSHHSSSSEQTNDRRNSTMYEDQVDDFIRNNNDVTMGYWRRTRTHYDPSRP